MKTRLSHAPTENDLEEIKTALRNFNRNFVPQSKFRALGIFVEDEQGNKQAGIVAETSASGCTFRCCGWMNRCVDRMSARS